MAQYIRARRDSSANWTAVDPTLKKGEIGIETNTGRYKVGDGSSLWSALDYFPQSGLGVQYLKSYTVVQATALDASNHDLGMIMVSDESGGEQPAFSDGTNWRKFSDRAVIS